MNDTDPRNLSDAAMLRYWLYGELPEHPAPRQRLERIVIAVALGFGVLVGLAIARLVVIFLWAWLWPR